MCDGPFFLDIIGIMFANISLTDPEATQTLQNYAEFEGEFYPSTDEIEDLLFKKFADPNVVGKDSELNFLQMMCSTFDNHFNNENNNFQAENKDYLLKILSIFLRHPYFDVNRVNDNKRPRSLLHIIASIRGPYTHLFIERIIYFHNLYKCGGEGGGGSIRLKGRGIFDLDVYSIMYKDLDKSCIHNMETPLHILLNNVMRDSQREALNLLLKAGADPNSVDGNGKTPLHNLFFTFANISKSQSGVTTEEQNEEINQAAQILLSYGADPNLKTITTGFTPLHEAAMCPLLSIKVCNTLLQKGNPFIRSRRGETVLELAARRSCLNMLGAAAQRRLSIAMFSQSQNHGLASMSNELLQAIANT